MPNLELFVLPCPEPAQPRGMVIVLPGGGYSNLAAHEDEPIARKMNEFGFHAAVCRYRVRPNYFPAPLEDARAAVRYVRTHAAELQVKPDKIAVLGFSAGGHLAAMVSAMPGDATARPDASILCYPVLSPFAGGELANLPTFEHLVGEKWNAEQYRNWSWPEQVTADTPPAFLWHTADDEGVPVENSLEYAAALKAHGVDFELHIFAHGRHGLGLGVDERFPEVRVWPELLAAWLKRRGW